MDVKFYFQLPLQTFFFFGQAHNILEIKLKEGIKLLKPLLASGTELIN